WQFLAPAAVAAVAGLVLGPGVSWLEPLEKSAVTAMEPGVATPELALWHGWSLELALSLVTFTVGLGLLLVRRHVQALLWRLPAPETGVYFDRGYDAVEAAGRALGRPHRTSAVASFAVWPLLALAALGIVALVGAGGLSGPAPGTSRAYDWVVLALLVVAAAAVVRTGRALVAVAALGVVGMLVTVWFILSGAPDVAITLLLVEALTAVVAVLALRGMPARFLRTPVRRRVPAAVLAGVLGVLTAAATLAFTGWRDRSPLGDYFLSRAPQDTGGRDVVNTFLVDYRALDTLGEATVQIGRASCRESR